LAKIVQKYPELAWLIQASPRLWCE